MEYGPRALGNRSILFHTGDVSVNDWLNELLRRTEFMPFAPSSLWEATDRLYENYRGGEDTARFMTTTFQCTPWMREHCPGVIHLDNTARPQLVRREDNPSYHALIKAYERLSGIPAIVNTSFNIHEEPIVRTADDALRAFLDSSLDYLQLGPFIARGPIGSNAVRRKWHARGEERVAVTSGAAS
jgi:carbamoyltransferase